jgi:hypothetical protein
VPPLQGEQKDPAVGLYVPGEHAVQIDEPLKLDEPAGQSLQLAAPPELNVPAAQSRQAKIDVLPVFGLYVPVGQKKQDDWPAYGLYVPVGHGMGAPPPVTKVPGGARTLHWLELLAPVPEVVTPGGHANLSAQSVLGKLV